MTKFEMVGVDRQLKSRNPYEAKKFLKHSCDVCCRRGMQISCDKCAIEFTNLEILATFSDRKNRELQLERKIMNAGFES